MEEDTKLTELRQPHSIDDPLTEIARDGARRMLAAALRAEADAFVADLAEVVARIEALALEPPVPVHGFETANWA